MKRMVAKQLPPRRWFSFSLRTLFVAVTVFGVWLGLNVMAVRERKDAAEWIRSRGGWPTDGGISGGDNASNAINDPSIKPNQISFIRRVLGDVEFRTIVLPGASFNENDREQIERLFPESNVPLFYDESTKPVSPATH